MTVRLRRRAAIASLAGAVTAVGLIAAPSSAAPVGGEQGVLRMHGPGTAFAGSKSLASRVVSSPGSTASFSILVKNTGTETAQFNVQVFYNGGICPSGCADPTDVLAAGSLTTTPLAEGPNGYFTAPIAPGKTSPLTFKIITPKAPGSHAGDSWSYFLVLNDTAGQSLDVVYMYASNRLAASTLDADQYVSVSGTSSTTPQAGGQTVITAPTLAVGATATFTIKLKNDGPTPTPIHYAMYGLGAIRPGCDYAFSEKVLAGTVNVTNQVLTDTYATQTLAHGASVTLKLKIKYLVSAVDCLIDNFNAGYAYDSGIAYTDTSTTEAYFVVNPLAEN